MAGARRGRRRVRRPTGEVCVLPSASSHRGVVGRRARRGGRRRGRRVRGLCFGPSRAHRRGRLCRDLCRGRDRGRGLCLGRVCRSAHRRGRLCCRRGGDRRGSGRDRREGRRGAPVAWRARGCGCGCGCGCDVASRPRPLARSAEGSRGSHPLPRAAPWSASVLFVRTPRSSPPGGSRTRARRFPARAPSRDASGAPDANE